MPSKFATGYVVKGNDNNIYHVFGTKQGIFKWDVNENRDIKISEDNPLEINIIDNWIYYHHNSQIKKIKVDGTSTNILIQAAGIGSSLHAVGDWIYYNFTNNNTRSICKIKLDGTQNTKIIDNLKVGQYVFFINNDWIYFIDDGSFIYKARTDGSEKSCIIKKSTSEISVYNNFVYFISANYLYKANLDGTNVEKICEDMASFFKVSDDYIFYCNNNVSGSSVCRLDLDGKNKIKLADSKSLGGCNNINVVDGWVYYTINNNYETLYYRVKIDGSNDSFFF